MNAFHSLIFITDSQSFGGAEKYIAQMSNRLQADGVTSKIFCRARLAKDTAFLDHLENRTSIEVIPLLDRVTPRALFRFIRTLRLGSRPCSVHLNHTNPFSWRLFYLPLLCRVLGARGVFVTEHLPRFDCRWIKRFLKRAMSRFITKTITVSESGKTFLCDYFRIPAHRIEVIHNGVADELGANPEKARKLLSIEDSTFVILQVGSICRRKGQLLTVEAMKALSASRPEMDWLLLLVGEGPDASAVEEIALAAGISDRVRLCGHHRDVSCFYSAADLFVLPSEKEAFPLSILEAMSYGLPVVATNVDGIPEQVAHGQNGFLLFDRDTGLLASCIAALFDSNELRLSMSRQARALYNEKFQLENCFEKTMNLWRSTIALNEGEF